METNFIQPSDNAHSIKHLVFLTCANMLAYTITSCTLIGPTRGVEIITDAATSNNQTSTNTQKGDNPDHNLSPNAIAPSVKSIPLTNRHYKAMEFCQNAVLSIPKTLKLSTKPLTQEQRRALKWPSRVESYTTKSCESFRARGEIMNDFSDIFTVKTPRVGIILPPINANEATLKIILDQINSELVAHGYNPQNAVIIKRIEKNFDLALKAAAELAHMDRVSLIVGGLNAPHAAAIAQISDFTQTPSLIINGNASLGATRQSMRVYPPLKRLASSLIDALQRNDVHKALVIYPSQANLEFFNLLKSTPSQITFSEATYTPDNPQSILNAVKEHFATLAQAQGRPSVIIFDNFRMVRHIVNIVATALPSQKILFAGNQQWRSAALVSPPDENLQGSLFVDFIGSYRNLPPRIEVPVSDNNYFTSAQAASKIDYQIIGHRLGSLISESLQQRYYRHEIAYSLQNMRNKWDSYFPNQELAFDAQRDSSWPVFLFEIQPDTIKEL